MCQPTTESGSGLPAAGESSSTPRVAVGESRPAAAALWVGEARPRPLRVSEERMRVTGAPGEVARSDCRGSRHWATPRGESAGRGDDCASRGDENVAICSGADVGVLLLPRVLFGDLDVECVGDECARDRGDGPPAAARGGESRDEEPAARGGEEDPAPRDGGPRWRGRRCREERGEVGSTTTTSGASTDVSSGEGGDSGELNPERSTDLGE
mmetsp:Transcript_11907/g.27423  ORF Transcript_11907/g.27423 Transcript_11907/m.27423 type:complete len:212 (-) Transcript_11907:193-828(-)